MSASGGHTPARRSSLHRFISNRPMRYLTESKAIGRVPPNSEFGARPVAVMSGWLMSESRKPSRSVGVPRDGESSTAAARQLWSYGRRGRTISPSMGYARFTVALLLLAACGTRATTTGATTPLDAVPGENEPDGDVPRDCRTELCAEDVTPDQPRDGFVEEPNDRDAERGTDVSAPDSLSGCAPDDPPLACGTATGACERGLRLCGADGRYSPCVVAPAQRTCSDRSACVDGERCRDGSLCGWRACTIDDDCGLDSVCVSETWSPLENWYDECEPGGSAEACERNVCRTLVPGASCAADTDCGGDVCVHGLCHRLATAAAHERCNGVDDNCDGSIDDDVRRIAICGPCPWNMQLVFATRPDGTAERVCVDIFEVSRPDASATTEGIVDLYVLPQAGVIPVTGVTPEEADVLCRGDRLKGGGGGFAPRRLCRDYELTPPCAEDYVTGMCNDASVGAGLVRTGTRPDCCQDGFCDAVGNAAELVVNNVMGEFWQIGGSFNTDPLELSCSNVDEWQRVVERDQPLGPDGGFRCCTASR